MLTTAERIAARHGHIDHLQHRIRRVLDTQPATVPGVIVDLTTLHDEADLDAYLGDFAAWLAAQPIELLSADRALAAQARRLLEVSP